MRFAKRMKLNSLSMKVLLAYVAGMLLSITLLVIAAVAALQSNALARMDLADLAEDMATKVYFDETGKPAGLRADEDDLEWAYESLRRETAYRVLDATGNVALLSNAGESFWPEGSDPPVLARGRFDFEHDGVTMHGVTEPLLHGGRQWYFQVAASTRLMMLLHRVALPLVAAGIVLFGLVLLVAFGLCAYVTLRYTLKPLRDMSESAAAISPRSLHVRLKTDAVPTEIAPLVEGFNRVLERLELGYRTQQDFLATAAHELKTPLALIRAQAELGEPSSARTELLQDVEHMTRQVQQLLHLAEASEAQNYQFTNVDARGVAEEAAHYLMRMADAHNVRLEVAKTTDAVYWQGDHGALFTLLKNLLENAIQHTPPGTRVSVEVNEAGLSVRDWGPGVPHDQLATIFARFWRGAHRRDAGAGLGLAICQEIALAHGWTICAKRANPGLRVEMSMKAAA